MLLYCLYLLAGAYSLSLVEKLPATATLFACLIGGIACLLVPRLRPLAAIAAGFVLMAVTAGRALDDRLDPALVGETEWLSARIDEFVRPEPRSLQFVVRPLGRPDLPSRIRLSWLDPGGMPQIGETWRLAVKLRRPRGYANPGGFDFEGWLFRQRIGATGYVVGEEHSFRVQAAPITLAVRVRRHIVERIERVLPDDEATAVLMAISVGARHRISRQQWEAYAATGTSHLIAISGLHIGLAAAAAFLFCRLLSAPWCRQRNARDLATLAAVVTAFAYAALSGFAIPARRASLMVLAAAFLAMVRRRLGPATILSAACLLIVSADPLAIMAPGFQLSFAAVAILLLVASESVAPLAVPAALAKRLVPLDRLKSMQLALLAGLFPLTAWLFGRFALVAPMVNLLVLPVFNFVTVPAALLGILCDGPLAAAGDALLGLAHDSIGFVLRIVHGAHRLPYASFHVPPGSPVLLLTPALYVLLPKGWPGRRIALLAVLVVLVSRPPAPEPGCFRYHVLDVGQGLAAVIRTHSYALLFDTGPAFQSGSTAADLVIVPFLRHAGIERLDHVIVSHGDLDHAGGIGAVIRGVESGRILVGERLDILGSAQRACTDELAWERDGVSFRFLHPRPATPWRGNNASCVLQIVAGSRSMLVTGDIEAPVETLLAYRGQLTRSDIVVVPHHGSRTSSGTSLVDATRPETAIVAAGYGNRWGFPKDEVVERWRSVGATVLETSGSGAISQELCGDGSKSAIRQQRTERPRYWSERTADAAG